MPIIIDAEDDDLNSTTISFESNPCERVDVLYRTDCHERELRVPIDAAFVVQTARQTNEKHHHSEVAERPQRRGRKVQCARSVRRVLALQQRWVQ